MTTLFNVDLFFYKLIEKNVFITCEMLGTGLK